jgi:hypothetical protein
MILIISMTDAPHFRRPFLPAFDTKDHESNTPPFTNNPVPIFGSILGGFVLIHGYREKATLH